MHTMHLYCIVSVHLYAQNTMHTDAYNKYTIHNAYNMHDSKDNNSKTYWTNYVDKAYDEC